MKKNTSLRQSLYCLVLLLTTCSGWYCKHETPPLTPGDPGSGNVNPRTDCTAFLSFEAETTTYGKLVNPNDESRLEAVDRILLMPHRERYRVETCYKPDGSEEIEINYLEPDNPIVYGPEVADAWYKPEYSRVVINTGRATYYDQYGAVMNAGIIGHDQDLIDHIVEAAGKRTQVPSQTVRDKIFEVLKDNNVVTETSGNNDYVTMKVDNPDGSYTRQVIDKKTLTLVGNFGYNSNGELESRLLMDMDGTAEAPVLRNILLESKFQAVSSPDIPVRIVQHSQISNFTFITN